MQPAVLKPLTPCKLEIQYLYTPQATIRFDRTAVERVHVIVYSRDMRTLYFSSSPVPTEDAREISGVTPPRSLEESRRCPRCLTYP